MLTNNKINGLEIREKSYTLPDSHNLYLLVKPNGGKYWRMRYTFHSTARLLSLGKFPQVDSSNARRKRDEILRQIEDGIDPVLHRENKKLEESGTFTLNSLVDEYYKNKELKDKTRKGQIAVYETYFKSKIGQRKIDTLQTYELIQMCKKIEYSSVKITGLALLKRVLRYGKIVGLIKVSPLEDVKGAIKTHKTKHHPCIIDGVDNRTKRMRLVGHLLADIHNYSGSRIIAIGLFFMAFTFQRPSEVRTMVWDDIDLSEKLWRFNSSKMNVQRIVPLSDTIIEILEKLKNLEYNSFYVLPNHIDKSKPTQLCSYADALKSMGYKRKMVPHGFRALARTILEEDLNIAPHLIEMQLSHRIRDPLGRAYNRTTHMYERAVMMQKWGKYLNRCYRLVTKEECLTTS